jgi:hypothetical protein
MPHLGPCWLWTGGHGGNGYGVIIVGYKADRTRRQIGAHVFAHELFVGAVPPGMFVLHMCDNGPIGCVNPTHLSIGTHLENMADMRAKGRQNIGVRNPKAKLTEAAVVEIRRLVRGGEFQTTVAAMFGVASNTVSEIVNGKLWSHVPDTEAA